MIPMEPLTNSPPLESDLTDNVSAAIIPDIAIKEDVNDNISISDIFFNALPNIKTLVDIPINNVVAFTALALNSPIIEYILVATNNSANNPPIDASDPANFD